jgi:hypothetical protein
MAGRVGETHRLISMLGRVTEIAQGGRGMGQPPVGGHRSQVWRIEALAEWIAFEMLEVPPEALHGLTVRPARVVCDPQFMVYDDLKRKAPDGVREPERALSVVDRRLHLA